MLYSARKVIFYRNINDSVGYEMQRFFTSWNSPKCHSRKNLNCQVHQGMKLRPNSYVVLMPSHCHAEPNTCYCFLPEYN